MAFSERIIPTLVAAGIEWVIVPNNHISRACQGYPYSPSGDNNDPPNAADQVCVCGCACACACVSGGWCVVDVWCGGVTLSVVRLSGEPGASGLFQDVDLARLWYVHVVVNAAVAVHACCSGVKRCRISVCLC